MVVLKKTVHTINYVKRNFFFLRKNLYGKQFEGSNASVAIYDFGDPTFLIITYPNLYVIMTGNRLMLLAGVSLTPEKIRVSIRHH